MARKLRSKQQQVWFDKFARQILENSVLMRAQADSTFLTEENIVAIKALIETADVSDLADQAGLQMLSQVDFKSIVKVDNFMNALETKEVLQAAMTTGEAVQDVVESILVDLFRPKE